MTAAKEEDNGRPLRFPASDKACGHAATGMAKFYKRELTEFMASVPKRGCRTTSRSLRLEPIGLARGWLFCEVCISYPCLDNFYKLI
jgi:hypothetical protein